MDFNGLNQFKNQVNLDEINAAIANEGTSKFFGPGTYSVKIKEIDVHKNKNTGSIKCGKDETWFNVRVVLADESGREKSHFLQIPTSKLTYNEGNSKAPYFVFRNLTKFMAAVGVTLTVENVGEIVPTFFNTDGDKLLSPEKLVGQEIKIDIGYKGKHVLFTENNEYVIMLGKNKPAMDDEGNELTFPSADAAKVHAATELGISNINSFPEIVNFHAGEYKPKEQPVKVASSEW